MSDFLLDFRTSQEWDTGRAAMFLRFFPDIQVFRFEESSFSLVLSRCDDIGLWGPYCSIDKKIIVALVGRIALESNQWEDAKRLPGNGGLACKFIYKRYKNNGINGLRELNGSYVAMVFDADLQKFFLVSDRSGMFPFFKLKSTESAPMFCSHPDLLASVSPHSEGYDITSLCEFIMTGQVSYPFTYYRGISAAEYGSIHTVDLSGVRPIYEQPMCYFQLNFRLDESISRSAMAERLSVAFKNAVRRRTHSQLGTLAIGLSGGLDSRMVLCACTEPERVTAFCFYNEENIEYKTAQAIAVAKGTKFVPLKRDFEYYGISAEAGVMISGGMSSLATNHYLGFREQLRGAGFDNILSGLYCDYFFKGLMMNSRINALSRNETPAAFSLEWYSPFFPIRTDEGQNVNWRLKTVYPLSLRQNTTDLGLLEIERRRLFPLCYEPDNNEVLIPQRIMGWYMPMIDNEILDVYLMMSPRFKFDRSMYAKAVEIICGTEICRIPNSNTGLPIGVSYLRQLYKTYINIIKENIYKRLTSPRLATSGSWQNWEFYLHNSKVVRELWKRKNPEAQDLLTYILGYDPFCKPIIEYRGRDIRLFLRLLTLKIWMDIKKV